jgi:hypothetical protein
MKLIELLSKESLQLFSVKAIVASSVLNGLPDKTEALKQLF